MARKNIGLELPKRPMMGEPIAEGRRPQHRRSSERTMVVPLDGSVGALSALPVALALAEQLRLRVEVLYVSASPLDDAATADFLAIPPEQHVRVAIRTVVGLPSEEILKTAMDPQVELVVLATAGHSASTPGHLAPVAEDIAARAVRPVVLVPHGGTRPAGRFSRLVVPLDGSLRTTVALKPAMSLARRLGARLDLLYVVCGGPAAATRHSAAIPMYMDHLQEWDPWRQSAVEQYRYRTRCGPSVDIGVAISVGEPAEEIVRFAQEHEEDAIVLVRASHLEYGRAAVLRPVIEKTPCPVILVPYDARRGGPR
jgi:nucleotide-binding universal stress UspA family protein